MKLCVVTNNNYFFAGMEHIFSEVQCCLCRISSYDVYACTPNSNVIILLDGVNHKVSLIGGTAAVGVEVAVQKHDDQARDGQQVQQPRLGRAGGVGPVERQPECAAQCRIFSTSITKAGRQSFGLS